MILVAGDAHIGSCPDLGRLSDQASSWRRLCIKACEMEADVIGTGDWLHHRKPSTAELDAFQEGLRILRGGRRTFVSAVGNHEIGRADEPSSLEVACAGFDAHALRAPQVVGTTGGPVGFLPWAPWTHIGARQMSENLMVLAEQLADDGARTLIAHWAIAGASVPTGLPVLDLPEPLIDPHRLAELFDVTIAGHIHKRQEIVPSVWHAGALCWRDSAEAQLACGAWQVEGPLAPDETLNGLPGVAAASWFAVPDTPFAVIDVDVRTLGAGDATSGVLEISSEVDVEQAIVRVLVHRTADQTIDVARIRQSLEAEDVRLIERIDEIADRPVSTRSQGVSEASDPADAFRVWMDAQRETVSMETHEAALERGLQVIGGAA